MNLEILANQEFYEIENARLVVGSDLFYDSEFSTGYSVNPFNPHSDLLQEEVVKRIKRTSLDGRFQFNFTISPVDFGGVNARVFPLSLMHPYNYFHFLIEGLPFINSMISNGMVDRNSVILTSHLHSSHYDAMRIVMGSNFARVFQMNILDSIKPKVTIMSPSPAHAVERFDGKTPEFKFNALQLSRFRGIFEKFLDGRNPLKIMIRRNSEYRRLLNQIELEIIAKKNGFIIVQPERLSFVEQIKLFSNATHIIGPTGAWLANLLFVSPAAIVDVIFPNIEECPPPSLWSGLANCFGITVNDVYGETKALNFAQPIHSDFILDENYFIDLIRGKNVSS